MKKSKLSFDDCLSYMNNKYGEEFIYLEPYDNFPSSARTLKIFVKSESYPDSKILVVEEIFDDLKLFHDNYVAVKYEKDTAKLLTDIATQVYGECRVIYSIDKIYYLSDEFNNKTTFEEYISLSNSHLRASILIPPSHGKKDKDNDIDKLYKELCNNNVVCTFNVYYTTDEEKYESLSSLEEINLADSWYNANGQLIINDKYEITSLMWR